MKAVCPNNPEHGRFVTTAHVMQEWFVDSEGNYLDTSVECLEVSHRPDPDNLWTCAECEDDPDIQTVVYAKVSHD